MSDASDAKVAKLENINRFLRFHSIFYAVGMFLLVFGWAGGIPWSPSKNNIMFIFWVIIGLPKILAVLRGGIGAALFGPLKADYEMVTVDGFGNVRSTDSGFLSLQMKIIVRLIQIAVVLVIGPIFAILHVIILSVKYAITAITTKAKSSVIPNGFVIILINIAVFVGGLVLGVVVGEIHKSVRIANYNAEHGVITSGDFVSELTATKDGRIITDYKGKGGSVVFPATIDGLPVTVISPRYGFKDVITSVVIPEGVTDIASAAFLDCEKLTSVTLPQSVQRISSRAFGNCTSLTDVIIPSGHTIRYGTHLSGQSMLTVGATYVAAVDKYFQDEKELSAGKAATFKGCTKLSAASRQAIQASGYDGDF